MMVNKDLPLTLVLVKDEGDERISAYFEEMPNIHASGDNEKEATQNLVETVGIVFKHKQVEAEKLLKEKEKSKKGFKAKRELVHMTIGGLN